jgi:PGAP1-like protein
MVASVIIGIHGLANKPPADEKKEWWKRAIIEGLKRNTGKTTDELAFDFVYWADLRYQPPISLDMNPEPYYPDEGVGSFPAYQTHKWVAIFNEITSVIGKEVNFLDLHTGVDKIGDFVLERELQDLAAYYEDENFRSIARQRLIDKLKEHAGKRIMLIGHSMGSIIAYDVLRIVGRATPPVSVDHFVTIGSPLGLPHVKTKIYEENDLVRTPSVVGRWTNFADRRDIVAVEAKLADDYEANDQGVKVADVPVINTYKSPPDRVPPNKPNFHKSYGYLRTPELSNVVRGFV